MFDIYWAECDPHLRWIRDDPRFAAILASAPQPAPAPVNAPQA
jgi:hypothetical protein